MMRSVGDARKDCWIDPAALFGDGCEIGKNVTITGCVSIGNNCKFYNNVVLGTPPQFIGCGAVYGNVVIGNDVTIRENVVVHAAVEPGAHTIIEDGCYIMTMAVVNHDCHIEDHVIINSGAILAGHVHVMKTAVIGQHASVHQFSVIGTGAIVGMNAIVVKDVPPYIKVFGNECRGENTRLSKAVTKEYIESETARFFALRRPERGDRVLDTLEEWKGRW